MKTIEQIKKIESVVLYVLRNFPEGVDYIKLFKIIYFAQKEYLVNYGKVLCPDTFKARKFGPVPALSDKVIKLVELEDEDIDQYPDLMRFRNSIRVTDQKVFGIAEPDMDYLSQKECEYLDKWFVYCKECRGFPWRKDQGREPGRRRPEIQLFSCAISVSQKK